MNKIKLLFLCTIAVMIPESNGESLRDEAEALLKLAIESREVEYTGYTKQQIINQVLEKINFEPLESSSIRNEADFKLASDENKVLQHIKLTIGINPITSVVDNKSARISQRESAYRLLLHFNAERKQRIFNTNVSNARILLMAMNDEGKSDPCEVKDYEKYKFYNYTSNQPKNWLYEQKGYGSILMLSKAKGEIWFMAPEPLSGGVIVAFKDFAVQSLPLAKIKEQISVPKSLEEAEAGNGQPATRPESMSESGDKPQPESEGRSR